jgi:hypothetical protein
LNTQLISQNDNRTNFIYSIIETDQEIEIDGIGDEAIWSKAQLTSDFVLNAPNDEGKPKNKTEVRLAFDSKNLYVLATCYDDSLLVVKSLKRDTWGGNDDFGIFIDPIGKKSNGFGFGVSAFGNQSEATMAPNNADDTWDNRWYSSVTRHDGKWVAEFKIPFKSFRFNEVNTEWGLNFVRIDPGNNETSVWAAVPRQFDSYDIGYYGTLKWPTPPVRDGGNISLIPYTTIRVDKNNDGTKGKMNFGGDAKIAITPSLNLDLTTFSDFSQVDVDVQVSNLTRFNIFFPERRQFFIENNDIFNGFGQGVDRVFYSRRIGLNAFGNPTPILFGARISGNLNEKLRIGALNMQTEAVNNNGANNFSALAFQQRVFDRSMFRGIFLNRQGFSDGKVDGEDFGRNFGGDFLYTTTDGKLATTIGYLYSQKRDELNFQNGQLYGGINYNGQNFRAYIEAQHVGKNYFSDMGFNSRIENYDIETKQVYRIGYTNVGSMANYYYYPKESKTVNYHWSGVENFVWVNDNGTGLNEWYTRLRHFIFFKNTTELRFRLNNNFVRLIYPFALTEVPLPKGEYNMTEFNIQYSSDTRKLWQYDIFAVYGQFYNGYKHTYRVGLTYRIQPWGNFRVSAEHNDIQLPQPYGKKKITLGTIRSEINFSTKIFWTTFFQYNTQADNFNINSRIQYRFAPMSDLFLVYSDNYGIETNFVNKERSVVLKFNYWLTL